MSKYVSQILDYMKLERQYRPTNNIFAILYDTKSKKIKCWKNDEEIFNETTINSFEYYLNLFDKRTNDKLNVIETTNSLNEDLHSFSIYEDQRSQFI